MELLLGHVDGPSKRDDPSNTGQSKRHTSHEALNGAEGGVA